MRVFVPTVVIVALSTCGLLGVGVVMAQDAGEELAGEKLGPEALGPGIIETMQEVMDRDLLMRPKRSKSRTDEQGLWSIPSQRVKTNPSSGDLCAVNKWGDTQMGIGFPESVDVHGAYFAGVSGQGVWTSAIRVIGYHAGEIVHETEWFSEIGSKPQWFAMELSNVDRIEIVAEQVMDGAGWYCMDDLTYSLHIESIEPYQDTARKIVVDFEDLVYNTKLTGSNYAGLTWETGTGSFASVPAIHAPMGPPLIQDEEVLETEEKSSRAGTPPNLVISQQRVKQGDDAWHLPPDTMGAIGPDHYVIAVNTSLRIYNKSTHSLVYNTTLQSFLGGSNAGDPRCLFDQDSQKWFVIDSTFSSSARIYLAVSMSDDPTGPWWKSYIVTDQGSDAGKWPDYPTLGIDDEGVYTSAYMVGGSYRMTIWGIEKAPLVDGSPSWGTVTAWRELTDGTIQPAHTYGSTNCEYLIQVKDSNELRVRRVLHPLTSPSLSIMGTASVSNFVDPPDAPALGSSVDIDTVGSRLMMAVYRADTNSLWTTHCISGGAGAASRWYEINPSGPNVKQYGTVSDGTWYYYFPSIMVNQYGSVTMGFTGSHSGAYAGCFYTGRMDSDPDGDMATPVQYKAGESAYNQLDGYGRNRWGDYSYITLDPDDQKTFWMLEEYAESSNRWGTYMAVLDFNDGDCQPNGIADMCDLDCGTPGGYCDVPGCGQSDDCNGNDVPDECDIAGGTSADCNSDGTPDECNIADCDPNDVDCQDCNDNGVPDECDIADCDPNDVACQDCQPNGIPDECDLLPPGNTQAQDDCADAQIACPGNTYTGSNSAATTDGSASCATSGKDVWYYYIPNGYGSAIISLCGSNFDTVLSVHSACPGTTGNELDCDDDYCAPQSRLSFSVSPGTSYWIRIAGKSDATGNFSMTISGPDCQYDGECYDNDIPDECDLADCAGSPWCSDCQPNGVLDWCDINEGTSSDTNTNGIPDECEGCAGQERGDTNGDGSINSLDIDPFVEAISNPAQYNIDYAPLLWECTSDINCDGSMNSLDIDPFVECLSGSCPPCP